MSDEDLKNWNTEPTAPKIYTQAQYNKLVETLSRLKRESKSKAEQHYELAKDTGLIYFIGGLETPSEKVWKMRD